MGCQKVVIVWDKNINSWNSEVEDDEETMANEQSQNGRGEYKIHEITCANRGVTLNDDIYAQGGGGWKIGHNTHFYAKN